MLLWTAPIPALGLQRSLAKHHFSTRADFRTSDLPRSRLPGAGKGLFAAEDLPAGATAPPNKRKSIGTTSKLFCPWEKSTASFRCCYFCTEWMLLLKPRVGILLTIVAIISHSTQAKHASSADNQAAKLLCEFALLCMRQFHSSKVCLPGPYRGKLLGPLAQYTNADAMGSLCDALYQSPSMYSQVHHAEVYPSYVCRTCRSSPYIACSRD